MKTKALKTVHNIDIKYRIAYFRIRKKKFFEKSKKGKFENSETSEISEISEKLFRAIFFPSFQFCPRVKIENSDLKIPEKKFLRFPRFSWFPSFRPGR